MNLLLPLLALLACGTAEPPPAPEPAKAAPPPGTTAPAPDLVLLVVLDTVRADHLDVCGYERPTSKELRALRDEGATIRCDAYSPAPWTLPSHASFFTGLSVPEHGLALAPEATLKVNDSVSIRPLGPSTPTLAEAMKRQGYQTLFLSANPVIKEATGLHRGFDVSHAAVTKSGGLRGPALIKTLDKMLETVDPEQPLFAVVNVYDAHDPYPAVPERVPWLPTREEMRLSPTRADAQNPFWRFATHEMDPAESEAWLAHVTDTYDYAVRQADKSLGRVLSRLREAGFGDQHLRLIVTSDHGEFLGEHGLMRHGGSLYEPVVRVPFVWYDSAGVPMPELPPRFSAAQAFSLLSTGAVDPRRLHAHAVSTPNPSFFQRGERSVAVWHGDEKGTWIDGESSRFDLGSDEGELSPGAVPPGEMATHLDSLRKAYELMESMPVEADASMVEALRAMGYVE